MQVSEQHRIGEHTLHISHQSDLLAIKKQMATMQARIQELSQLLMQTTQQPTKFVTIKVPINGGFHRLATDAILYCEAAGNYTKIVTASKTYMLSIALKSVEKLLPESEFIRCHQSYSINKKQIAGLQKNDGWYITLSTGTPIPVSRRNKKLVSNYLNDL